MLDSNLEYPISGYFINGPQMNRAALMLTTIFLIAYSALANSFQVDCEDMGYGECIRESMPWYLSFLLYAVLFCVGGYLVLCFIAFKTTRAYIFSLASAFGISVLILYLGYQIDPKYGFLVAILLTMLVFGRVSEFTFKVFRVEEFEKEESMKDAFKRLCDLAKSSDGRVMRDYDHMRLGGNTFAITQKTKSENLNDGAIKYCEISTSNFIFLGGVQVYSWSVIHHINAINEDEYLIDEMSATLDEDVITMLNMCKVEIPRVNFEIYKGNLK